MRVLCRVSTDGIVVHFICHFFNHDAIPRGSDEQSERDECDFEVPCSEQVSSEQLPRIAEHDAARMAILVVLVFLVAGR